MKIFCYIHCNDDIKDHKMCIMHHGLMTFTSYNLLHCTTTKHSSSWQSILFYFFGFFYVVRTRRYKSRTP